MWHNSFSSEEERDVAVNPSNFKAHLGKLRPTGHIWPFVCSCLAWMKPTINNINQTSESFFNFIFKFEIIFNIQSFILLIVSISYSKYLF